MKFFNKPGTKMRFLADQNGFSLLEVLISLVILGILAVGMLSAMAASSKVILQTDARETAKNLAETQMENLKNEPYVPYESNGTNPPAFTPAAGYSAYTLAEISPALVGRFTPTLAVYQNSTRPDVQTLTVTVKGPGIAYVLEDYKVR